jgi:chromosome segregation ATPase
MAQMLVRPGDTVTATVADEKVVPVLLSNATLAANSTTVGARVADTQKAVQAATAQIEQLSATAAKAADLEAANAQIQQLSTDLKAREATLATLHEQFTALTSRVAVLEKPPAPGAQGD